MLTTTQDVKTYLGIVGSGEEDLITLLVKLASQAIKTIAGWEIEKATYSNQRIDGGDAIIRLKAKPIDPTGFVIQLNNGTVGVPRWVDMLTSNYVLHLDEGVVEQIVPLDGILNLQLTYTAGYATIPADLELLCIELVARMYNKRKSEGISSEGMESVNVTYATELLTEFDKAIIEQYKLAHFVI